jgi:hypothetical protein
MVTAIFTPSTPEQHTARPKLPRLRKDRRKLPGASFGFALSRGLYGAERDALSPSFSAGGKGALQTRTWRAERDAAVKIFIREAETIGPHRRGWHTDTVTFLLPS